MFVAIKNTTLETSHPRLLPQSPKDCSIHLCLFFCFAYRVIINIETCILSRVKQITSPSWMHETSARTWCTGKT